MRFNLDARRLLGSQHDKRYAVVSEVFRPLVGVARLPLTVGHEGAAKARKGEKLAAKFNVRIVGDRHLDLFGRENYLFARLYAAH